jgi:O-antigen/teichoic acid export membrane protein
MTTFRDAARGAAGSPRALVAETALVTGVGAVVVGGAGALLLPSLLGSGFGDAVPLLLWLLPGTLGIALMRVCGNELSGRGRPGVVAWVAGIQGIAMVVGFVALIPGHGPTAAAIVSSVGYLLGGASCAVVLVTMSRPPLSPETAPA